MKIDMIKVGRLRCNCYLLSMGSDVLVIDPGDDGNKIIEHIDNKHVVGIVITHHHPDHDGAVNVLLDKYNCMVYDRCNLNEGVNKILPFVFEVIYTPGHKEDLITLYFKEEKVMFCGDFIFKDSIGRCDLHGSSIKDMTNSLKKIMSYDNDITIYPGHGIRTTLGYEINNNVYFNEFL
ncbi:MAG: MBL fold metallo-hydrolase [Bacilli bacterium]|nr:MBL fold metallo-hydrolase [Bacilli bacterium]